MLNSYRNAEAIRFLASQVDTDEAGTSSHWRKMHSDFKYHDGNFYGLQGFGTLTPRSRWLNAAVHSLLQRRWRKFGEGMNDFHSLDKICRGIAYDQGRVYDLDMLRQVLTLTWLKQKLAHLLSTESIIVVIGDGFGTFSSLLLNAFPNTRVIAVNLVKTLLVDIVYVLKALPNVGVTLATNSDGKKWSRKSEQRYKWKLRA